jgi:hypothetical protein
MFLFIFLLSGCSKFNSSMEVKSDRSMTFSILYTYDTTVNQSDPVNIITEENRNNLLASGYTIEDINDGNNVGLKITKTIDNIDDVSDENNSIKYDLFDLLDSKKNIKLFKVERNFLYDTYKADFYINDKTGFLKGNTTSGFDDNGYSYSYTPKNWGTPENFSFNLKVPLLQSSNATKTDTLRRNATWDLSNFDSISHIKFQFYVFNKRNILILVGAIVIFIFFIIASNQKKDTPQNDRDNIKLEVPKKETYQTPINIPSTPVTTGEVNDSNSSSSFGFLNTEPKANNPSFDQSAANVMATDDVNFIMSEQINNAPSSSTGNNSGASNSNNSSGGMSSLESFMNSNNLVSSTTNTSPQTINNLPPLNSQGGIPEVTPELMSGISDNGVNNNSNNS